VKTAIDRGYWRDVVGAEYDSLPELSLTLLQAQRLWTLDADTCRWVLESFVESGYLTVTSDGRYRRADRPTQNLARHA
jgi:hypothetical protein